MYKQKRIIIMGYNVTKCMELKPTSENSSKTKHLLLIFFCLRFKKKKSQNTYFNISIMRNIM